jgi:hypothetical protein
LIDFTTGQSLKTSSKETGGASHPNDPHSFRLCKAIEKHRQNKASLCKCQASSEYDLQLRRGAHKAIQLSGLIPMRDSADQGCAAILRQAAAAIFVSPARRINPITVLRNAAIICGMLLHLTCDRSSSNVTSLTQRLLLSICQCCMLTSNIFSALARSSSLSQSFLSSVLAQAQDKANE